MSVIPFPSASGGFVFTCTGCDYTVHTSTYDGFPVCMVCRWFDERPQIPRDRIRALLQGEPVTRDSTGENGCGNG